ncbi:MAG: 3-oxocholest-4-en-26-oate---CoA ligase, partial [Actinomycetota bacterium]|nr:3-oxocholest-4-en-26-oate---CoA ligase [Actinomycetota bacterium]
APDRWDLTSLRAITSSGVVFSPAVKRGLLAHLPELTIVDSLGASEGLGPRNAARADDETIAPARFRVNDRIRVVDEQTGLDVAPGSDEVGLVAMGGRIPLGYFKDPEKTAATFRLFDGVRYSVPGDYATVDADGTVKLLGRGSACINTGGEKVYPEEVEAELRKHAGVFDCVVVGVPDERFGEQVVALLQVDDHDLDERAMAAWCRERLAGYKAPRRFLFVDSLQRSAAGKAHHQELRALAVELIAANGGASPA